MGKRDEIFTAGLAARLSGVPYRTVDYWARSNFIGPSVVEAAGKGSDRQYSFRDIVALKVAGRLRQAGISLQSLRRAVQYIQKYEKLNFASEVLVGTYLVSDGCEVFAKRGRELISMLRRPGQLVFAWVIDLGGVVKELQERMAA